MAKSFNRWLHYQADRDDSIGDLASDAIRDYWINTEGARPDKKTIWKLYPRGIVSWENHIIIRGACSEAIEALHAAWDEWKEENKALRKETERGK